MQRSTQIKDLKLKSRRGALSACALQSVAQSGRSLAPPSALRESECVRGSSSPGCGLHRHLSSVSRKPCREKGEAEQRRATPAEREADPGESPHQARCVTPHSLPVPVVPGGGARGAAGAPGRSCGKFVKPALQDAEDDQRAGHHHGCGTGVCHPAQHHGEAAL